MHIVKNSNWAAFCQRLTEQLGGAIIKLEAIEPDGTKTARVDHAELQSMEFNTSDPCTDRIVFHFREAPDYEIIGPVDISLRGSGSPDNFNPIRIESETGAVLITSRPAIHREILEELEAR